MRAPGEVRSWPRVGRFTFGAGLPVALAAFVIAPPLESPPIGPRLNFRPATHLRRASPGGPSNFQAYCEAALGSREGTIIALDPRNGRITAMVNPALAMGESFPPGSIFKLVVTVAALDERLLSDDFTVNCPGYYEDRGHRYRCSLARGHGRVNWEMALSLSCNTFYRTLGARVGSSRLIEYARRMGFHQPTGVNLPGEIPGTVPRVISPQRVPDFSIGDDEGLRVTPIAMASLVTALANGGKRRRPWYGSTHQPGAMLGEIGSARSVERVKRAMRDATLFGTGRAAQRDALDVAGKTGTATWVGGFSTHAWFVGFAPAENPDIAVVVFLKRGQGRIDSAPLAGKIFRYHFSEKRGPP